MNWRNFLILSIQDEFLFNRLPNEQALISFAKLNSKNYDWSTYFLLAKLIQRMQTSFTFVLLKKLKKNKEKDWLG